MIDKAKPLCKLPDDERVRVTHLLINSSLGEQDIGEVSIGGSARKVYSNCLGTALYCHGLEYKPFNIHRGRHEDHFSFPVEGRPGFMGNISEFEYILSESFERVENPSPGDMVLLRNEKICESGDISNTNIKHAAIYIGEFDSRLTCLFDQDGYAGKFLLKNGVLKDGLEKGSLFSYYQRK